MFSGLDIHYCSDPSHHIKAVVENLDDLAHELSGAWKVLITPPTEGVSACGRQDTRRSKTLLQSARWQYRAASIAAPRACTLLPALLDFLFVLSGSTLFSSVVLRLIDSTLLGFVRSASALPRYYNSWF